MRDAHGETGVAREVIDLFRGARGHARGEHKQRGRGGVGIAFQRGHRWHRIVVQIELMLCDQPRQPFDGQAEIPDRQQQFGGDRIALDAAVTLSYQEVGPPLQAHFPRAAAG